MKIYNGNNLVGEVKELTKENFNKYFSTNFTEYKNNCGYNIGDYVVYGGKLYKCIKTITVSEEFNPSKWEKVHGFNNISSLKIENDKLYVTFEDGERKEIKNFSLTNALNQQVEYGQFGFNSSIEQISTLDTLIPFKTKVGNIDLNSDGTITLKANKTYKLSCYFRITDTDALKSLSVKQNETFLFNVVAKASEITETCTSVYIFTPTVDAKVGVYTPSYDTQLPTLTSSAFYSNTKLIVEEIAQPVINNINYTLDDINNQTNIEDTPIGHIISFMGTKAPDHYLICDGSEYNITDYQKLADFINDQFGSYNYFGGNGTTTFAVPDLRNNISTEDLWSVPDGYAYEGTGVISTIRERTYNKKNEGKAIVANVNSTTDNATYCYLISTNQNYVIGYCSYDSSELGTVNASFDYKGFTWYISVIPYGFNIIETISSEYKTFTIDCNRTDYETIGLSVLQQIEITKIANSQQYIKYENTYYANIVNTITETVLYEGFANSGDISLTDNVKNYDYIEIYGCTTGSPKDKLGGHSSMTRIRVDEIDTFREYCCATDSSEDAYGITYFLSTTWYWCIKIKGFSDDTTLSIDGIGSSGWTTCGIYKVIGIKY